jgi:hypothetical protein
MNAIFKRHPSGSPEREAELRALSERHRVPNSLIRAARPALVTGLVNRRLRRHLAPTRQILVRAREPHSP